jgi:DNA-binding protein YbaB
MKKIKIDKSLVPSDDIDMLEDLILVAYNDAHGKIEKMTEESMKAATGGLNMGGLKLPF